MNEFFEDYVILEELYLALMVLENLPCCFSFLITATKKDGLSCIGHLVPTQYQENMLHFQKRQY